MSSLLEIFNSSKSRVPRKYLHELDHWLRPQLFKLVHGRRELIRRKLVVVFVGQRQGRKINLQFRGRNYATDVLSFEPVEPDGLGELIFCHDVIKNQAIAHGLSFQSELAYMHIHGVLHLLGYDHEKSQSSARRMFKIQDELFERWLERV